MNFGIYWPKFSSEPTTNRSLKDESFIRFYLKDKLFIHLLKGGMTVEYTTRTVSCDITFFIMLCCYRDFIFLCNIEFSKS